MDKEQWKAIKKNREEHLTVYKERTVARPPAMLESRRQTQTQDASAEPATQMPFASMTK